jgi:hypothetical protein
LRRGRGTHAMVATLKRPPPARRPPEIKNIYAACGEVTD